MAVEAVVMIAALILMAASVTVKILTVRHLDIMRRRIGEVDATKRQAVGRLKLVRAQQKVMAQTKAQLQRRYAKMNKKIRILGKELDGYMAEVERREQRTDEMRGKLVRAPVMIG